MAIFERRPSVAYARDERVRHWLQQPGPCGHQRRKYVCDRFNQRMLLLHNLLLYLLLRVRTPPRPPPCARVVVFVEFVERRVRRKRRYPPGKKYSRGGGVFAGEPPVLREGLRHLHQLFGRRVLGQAGGLQSRLP